ncbi:lipocalin/fatty-acid binding family protein [Collimonas sp.]|uniref:lipocalin/fatty-acid binding family protein n=1 Tax=Collimonas sp. TaxID=1963772 RepID=UPI002BE63232|nr:lipocalin/fatty-acid binding family protein [Collimonas sp.]HWW05074.1 lipocalin/fatty-acid binding family protein [Collimonas sp.]
MNNEIVGEYKMSSSDNYDAYLSALGTGMIMRKLLTTAKPTETISIAGDTIAIKISTVSKTNEIKFTLGQQFDETTISDKQFRTTVTSEGNILIQNQIDGDSKTGVITREFTTEGMTKKMEFGPVKARQVYTKAT